MDSPSEQRYNTEDRERFRHSTLDEQLDFLRLEVKAETLPELLLLCSELADSAPLLFLVEEAQKRGIVMEESLGDVLLKLSTPALHKLLQLPASVMQNVALVAAQKQTVFLPLRLNAAIALADKAHVRKIVAADDGLLW